MDIAKVHILIEQGLQQVGVFANSDFEPEEVDLAINKAIYTYLEKIFNPRVYNPSRGEPNFFEFNQEVLDRLQHMIEVEPLAILQNTSERTEFSFPEDYQHYIRSSSSVSPSDYSCAKDVCSKIEPSKTYKVVSGYIIYNGISYVKGSSFVGLEGFDSYSIVPNGEEVKVVEAQTKFKRNRVTSSVYIDKVLENSLYTTRISSPVGELRKNSIVIYKKDFDVNGIEFVYCRKPTEVSFANNIDLDFPDDVCYEIIDLVVVSLSIDSEQNPQKIAFKTEAGNVQR